MVKFTKQLSIYDPVSRARNVTIEGPELLIDCLERLTSCLDIQMLGETADGLFSCKITLEEKIDPIKRRRNRR